MTLVKSHVCASCGGQLKVHEDRQLYECSFCGATYNYEFFQLRDLQELANRSLKAMEFPSALKKFKFILTKDPHNFEALRGKVLCAAKVRSFDSFANLTKSYKGDLKRVQQEVFFAKENALDEDMAFFEKFDKMLELADEYKDVTTKAREYERALKQEEETVKELEGPSVMKHIPVALIYLALGVGSFLFINYIGLAVWLVICFAFAIGFAVYVAVADKKRKQQLAYHREQRSEKTSLDVEYKAKAEELKEKIDAIYNELKEMEPEQHEEATEEVKIPSEKMRKGECPNCGGEMIINLNRNIYECLFCGNTLDYEFVRDENVYTSAIMAMKNSQYSEADDLFVRILGEKPDDANALLGRIMCAGKLNDVSSFRWICDNMSILLNAMKIRTQEAIDATEDKDREYFGKISEILENYEKYRAEANKKNSVEAKINDVREKKEDFEKNMHRVDNQYYYYGTDGELKEIYDGTEILPRYGNYSSDRDNIERAKAQEQTKQLLSEKLEEVSSLKEEISKNASSYRSRVATLYDEMRQIKQDSPLPELTSDNDQTV